MEIRVAETAGFCFGVNRAVSILYKMIEEGKNISLVVNYTQERAYTTNLASQVEISVALEVFTVMKIKHKLTNIKH